MTDVVSPATRSRIMCKIQAVDTKPEMIVRRGLHAHGFRYRLHDKRLPGRPDLVLKKYNAVIQVHGCFWHKHDCEYFKWPSSRPEFWREKLGTNEQRDKRNEKLLNQLGFRLLTVWECAFRGKSKADIEERICDICTWLESEKHNDIVP